MIKVERNFLYRITHYIAACIIKKVNFTKESFKKFIQLRTKLHDGICDFKKKTTIAVYDMAFIAHGKTTYTTKPPEELCNKPLPCNKICMGEVLFKRLQTKAEIVHINENFNERYEFLNSLLQCKFAFPCLMDNSKEIISFLPIVSSNVTKVSPFTKTVLVKVLDEFLKDSIDLFGLTDPKLQEKDVKKKLIVQQVRVEDTDGNEILTYPSQNDLKDLDKNDFIVVHQSYSNQIP